jgi:hypothetical protein
MPKSIDSSKKVEAKEQELAIFLGCEYRMCLLLKENKVLDRKTKF